MLLALVIAYCVAGTNECDLELLAEGFVHERQCMELAHRYILPAWTVLNPDKKVQRWVCVANPSFLLQKGKA